jgi:GntR family transcriptional regulator
MSLRPDDARAPYQQVAASLEERIRSGQLHAGDRLPTNKALAAEFGVATMTVQSALRLLREQGLVVSYQGRGTFVRDAVEADAQRQPTDYEVMSSQLHDIHSALDKLTDRVEQLEKAVRRRR